MASLTHSPVKDRFLLRIYKTFLRSLDGEKLWQDVYNGLSERTKHRFHRINVKTQGSEPAIDDVAAMHALREQAEHFACRQTILQPVMDSVYASMFFFEFEDVPKLQGSSYLCIGHIYCRIALPPAQRKLFHRRLHVSSSYFLVLGQPVKCVERLSTGMPLLRRRVTFSLSSLEDEVAITLRGITSQPHTISGLPRSAQDIIDLQGLRAPFGRADHSTPGKPLPQVPAKRKFKVL